MIWADLPPSIHIEDRRGQEPGTITIAEIFEALEARKRREAAIKPCAVAVALGYYDIQRRAN